MKTQRDVIGKVQQKPFSFLKSAWGLCLLGLSLMLAIPSLCIAQQPKAGIMALGGEAVVSLQGQADTPAAWNTVLSQGDAMQTYSGEHSTLELSDGSRIQLGEYTTIDFAELSQDARTGARVSHLYLLWGRIRAAVAPRHQTKGSSFRIETFNALITVTFSEPEVEVFYNPDTDTTIVLAHTVTLWLKNLLTGDVVLLSEGMTGIVRGEFIETRSHLMNPKEEDTYQSPLAHSQSTKGQQLQKLVRAFEEARLVRSQIGSVFPGTSSSQGTQSSLQLPQPSSASVTHPSSETIGTAGQQTELSGLSTGEKVALGAGTLAAAGGVAVILANGEEGTNNNPFTGTFRYERSITTAENRTFSAVFVYELNQDENAITGALTETYSECCTFTLYTPVSGTLVGENHVEISGSKTPNTCTGAGSCYLSNPGGAFNATLVLEDDGRILRENESLDYIRQ